MTSTQHVRVEGTSYQRGRQYGRQAADRVRLSVQAYQQTFAHFAGWDWPAVRREALRFEAPIGEFRPEYLDELRGIADGAGLDLADVLAINVRTEVMYSAKARQAPRTRTRLPAECSAFAVVPGPGQKAPAIIGQNWDWLLHSAQTLVVLEVRQDDGPDFVTVVEAGLLAKTGMNAAGLGLVTNALVTDADTGEPGLPYHVLLRAVLDCATVTDALEVLQAGSRASSRRPTWPCGPCPARPSGCSASWPPERPGRWTTSGPCWPITPTIRTASAPTPTRPPIRVSKPPRSPRC